MEFEVSMERYHRSCNCATVGSVTECVREWISVEVAIVNVLRHDYVFINSVKVDKWLVSFHVCGFTTPHDTADEETAFVNSQSINGIVGGPLTVNPLSIPRTA